MKHLLNNISEEERNSILEQHGGGMKVFNENFHKMVNKKLGHVDLYEQTESTSDASTFSTKKISELADNDKDRLRSSNSGVWDSLLGNTNQYGAQSFNKEAMMKILNSLNLFVVEKALGMTSKTMDEAINTVLSMLPQYFKDDTHVQNSTVLKQNLNDVKNILNVPDGLKLVKNVVLKNYNHNKTRTGAF